MEHQPKPIAPTFFELALGATFLGLVLVYVVRQHSSVVPVVVLLGFVVAARRFPRQKVRLDTSPVSALVTLLLFAGPISFIAIAVWRPEWTMVTATVLAIVAVVLYAVGSRIRRSFR